MSKPQIVDLTGRFSGGRPRRPESQIELIVIHHDAVPAPKSDHEAEQQLEAIDRQHKREGWGGIGYAYAIAPSGTIFKCRRANENVVHARGANHNGLGVMLMGYFHTDRNFHGELPTDAQLESLAWLVKELEVAYPSIRRVLPHRDVKGSKTACPGNLFPYERINGLLTG